MTTHRIKVMDENHLCFQLLRFYASKNMTLTDNNLRVITAVERAKIGTDY